MVGPLPDPESFPELLGRLVLLLRGGVPPHQAEARETTALLLARVADGPAVVEGGIENSWAVDGDPLRERLGARGVETIEVAAGTGAGDLLALALALADDQTVMPSLPSIRVTLQQDRPASPAPASNLAPPPATGIPAGPRLRPGHDLALVVEQAIGDVDREAGQGRWQMALHAAEAAIRMLPGLDDSLRRPLAFTLRRRLNRQVLEALIEQAYRRPEEQGRTVTVLRAAGSPAVELMLNTLLASEARGPRGFLVEALGGMPDAAPALLPLLQGERSWEVRLAAEILGRLRVPEAVPALAAQVQHPDEATRHTVIEALGRFRGRDALNGLRQGLAHDSPATRACAAAALAEWRSPALTMPLLAALETETDAVAWEALAWALAGTDSPEATEALVRLAIPRGGLLSRLSSEGSRRAVAVVRALGRSGSRAARLALEQIAVEGKGGAREAASRLLAGKGADPPPG